MTKWFENISLKGYNSFGVDVSAKRMAQFTTAEELIEILSDPAVKEGEWAVLGGGNNILFTADYNGTLIHPCGKEIEVISTHRDDFIVRAEAGVLWDDFVAWCVEQGLWGAENLSYIPSQVGAAPVQNIGAYGAEVKDIVASVETLDTASLKEITIAAEHCGFGYRESIFKDALKGRSIITAVNFKLSKTPSPNLSYGALASEVEKLGGPSLINIRQAVTNIRKGKLPEPSETGSAGSFFKNPVVDEAVAERLRNEYPGMPEYPAPNGIKLSAGWLIEQAGWKGKSLGRAGVYAKQALILVNNGGATGEEIIQLAKTVQQDVEKKFGIGITPEVNIW